jgi:F-type H+-transporting ATPase subunit delta
MAERGDLIRGYATALFQIAAAEGELDRVSDELFAFSKAVEQNNELRAALTDIAVPNERKVAVVDDLLGDKASELTRNLLHFVVAQGHARELPDIVESLSRLAAEQRNRVLAEVRSAIALTPDQEERLAAALSARIGKEVDVKVVVDPKVLGGIYAKVGDQVIDGTVRHRLEELKELLGGVS